MFDQLNFIIDSLIELAFKLDLESSSDILSAKLRGALSLRMYPVLASCITLLIQPTSVATTGVPQANDSKAIKPKLSKYDGITHTSAAE